MNLQLDELHWQPDSGSLFERLRHFGDAVWLDSAQPWAAGGRYDILVAEASMDSPAAPVATDGVDLDRYFTNLASWHRERYQGITPADPGLPFCGGLLGYIGYEPGNALHGITPHHPTVAAMPPIRLAAYDWCVIQDHLLKRTVLVSLPWVSPARRRDIRQCLGPGASARQPGTFRLHSGFLPDSSRAEYRHAFERIQEYIQAGDCYQVNLAQRFRAGYSGDPLIAYRVLREVAAAPFSGYVDLGGDSALLCLSPERFLSVQGRQVETRPIKGTRPRYADPDRDLRSARELRESPKDRAENLMIVDLLRNDLGRSCVPGSIHVEKLFELESYPTVHHLVSTIRGELAANRGPLELLRDSFPGGSITGAPKRRAMQIIAELEPCSREAYCGSLLYISADGRMDSNIAIRSLLCEGSDIRCWGGGGIVADSNGDQEYQETWDKVGRFFSTLEQRFGTHAPR
ncbi:aminodeoxychorismate synthase, component I [Kineobactrum sediminis]|uniref:aminodeoxychorismate synthase n=1 Tax=Kineobactrum sediminis TaxID=1905677 RepID=A0A2N5Y2I6_9GAMM|nr:aminodeoxychorismate synthase component I [Kineobactrum sediminis]PLW82610.1 aminodeoxychorismate synthase, component I [Kineobactrum sediminis]